MFSVKPVIEQEWYLVFEPSVKKRWFHRFLHPHFQHCYCMKKSEAGLFWIISNAGWSHHDIDYRSVETFPEPRDYAGDHAVIVPYRAVIDPLSNSCQPAILTCVDIVKRHLGLVDWRIWTPYQLYKHARKRNGRHP